MSEGTMTIAHGLLGSSEIDEAVAGDEGVRFHAVRSPFQKESTEIRVIAPREWREGLRVMFVLPVASHGFTPWGDPVRVCLDEDLAERFGVLCVIPTFSNMPWYADHPSDRRIRQETYVLDVVVPFVERRYRTRGDADGRLLLGFSKSGWGAYTLLLRHPQTFGRAAAWDAPLGQQAANKYGMSEVFGDYGSLEGYCVWELFTERAEELGPAIRLGLFGYDVFRAHHQATHVFMERHGIPHVYVDGPRREHVWGSGWVPELAEFLAG